MGMEQSDKVFDSKYFENLAIFKIILKKIVFSIPY